MLYSKSPFDILERNLEAEKSEVPNRIQKAQEKNTQSSNLRRKEFSFAPGSRVFFKTFNSDKLLSCWKGPFEVVEHKNSGSVVVLDGYRTTICNPRNLRPVLEREEDVVE